VATFACGRRQSVIAELRAFGGSRPVAVLGLPELGAPNLPFNVRVKPQTPEDYLHVKISNAPK
jgi:hypothetical protein